MADPGFKPFFVDLAESEAAQANAPKGRYLVIAVLLASSPTYTTDFQVVLVSVALEGNRRIHRLYCDKVTFVGFRGECIMCDKRTPEELL